MLRSWFVAFLMVCVFHPALWSDWVQKKVEKVAQWPNIRKALDESTLTSDAHYSAEEAIKGFIEPLKKDVIYNAEGKLLFDARQYRNIREEVPATVHPRLWHHFKLLAHQGLFKVTEGIYQIRGIDLANITFILGEKGIIVVDPLTSKETAAAALEQFQDYLQRNPDLCRSMRLGEHEKPAVSAVIITHSHMDHFGGIWGVVEKKDVLSGQVPIYAPVGFFEHAMSENILFHNVMATRAQYMYGSHLPVGPSGQVSAGLGLSVVLGTMNIPEPTILISETGEEHVIDGLRIIFQMAAGTEAPSEMLFFMPDLGALCTAEIACPIMHNLESLRGAQSRDAEAWVRALLETRKLFGKQAKILFSPHLWPLWGQERITEHLTNQSRLYQFTHDQAVQLSNKGYDATTIPRGVELPTELNNYSGNQSHYGHLSQNLKAVNNFYLGRFNGNPCNLDPLTPPEQAHLWCELVSEDKIFEHAKEKMKSGYYQQAVSLLSTLVEAKDNQEYRDLLATTYCALAVLTPNATWRNYYLSSAYELHEGLGFRKNFNHTTKATLAVLPAENLLSVLSTRIDAKKAAGKNSLVKLHFAGDKKFVLHLEDSVLQIEEEHDHHQTIEDTIFIDLAEFKKILTQDLEFQCALQQGIMKASSPKAWHNLKEILLSLDPSQEAFPLTRSVRDIR